MKKIIAWLLAATIVTTGIYGPQAVFAAETNQQVKMEVETPDEKQADAQYQTDLVSPDEIDKTGETSPNFDFGFWYDREMACYDSTDSSNGKNGAIRYYWYNMSSNQDKINLTVSSSDTSVVEIQSKSKTLTLGSESDDSIYYTAKKTGKAFITVKYGTEEIAKIPFYVLKSEITIKGIVQTGYQTAQISWAKEPGVDGYVIERTETKTVYDYKTIATIKGDSTTTASFTADFNKNYRYCVRAYMLDGTTQILGTMTYGDGKDFVMKKLGASITSVKKSGSSSFQVKWNKMAGAVSYELYQSTKENSGYKVIYKGTKTSYKKKVSKGYTYYYKVRTIYAGNKKSDFSKSISRFIPKKTSVKKKTQSNVSQQTTTNGQYGWSWSSPDDTYYYIANGITYMVCRQNNGNLKIYKLDAALKATAYKTIKLKYDIWGGFYQGNDGNFYVAIGYNNPNESKKKTVIKVIKYNKKWKKVKTASIKGSAGNSFAGIYIPFDAGNCRMDMTGNTLYLFTAREMFKTSDGLHHQSNISFTINTKTMKAKTANESYCSHSFNQYVKFKDNNLYLVDHGDAYPRSIMLTYTLDYGTAFAKTSSVSLFNFKGESGNNYTGATVDGMEVGEKNLLVCGTSQPHGYAVSGIKGFDGSYKKNVYVIVANKETGKKTVKWLTSYNPKTTSFTVSESRMIKLADDRFAVMYSTTQGKNSTLHYVVINNDGKKIYSKTYSGMAFAGGSQPVLNAGSILWTETYYKSDYTGMTTKTFRIPAVY